MSDDDRQITERQWESEVMLRAAGWIFFVRGASLGLGGALGLVAAAIAGAHRMGWLALVAPALGTAACGLAILCSVGWIRVVLAPAVLAWLLFLLTPFAPASMGLQGGWDILDWSTDPLVRSLLPALFLPDLFALYAILRKGARGLLSPHPIPLAPLASAWRIRLNGRVLVSLSMVTLALLSAAICLVGLPGFILA